MRPTQYSRAARARDEGLRRVRKITWQLGLLSAAAAAVIAAKFAHFAPSLPHLSVNDAPSGGSSSSGAATGASSGLSPSSGVSPAPGGSSSGGGVTTSGGS